MPIFRDLAEFFDPDLVLPIRGKSYVIPPPSVTEVLKLRIIFADPDRQGTGLERLVWQARMLGATLDVETSEVDAPDDSVWAQMVADGVSAEEMLLAGNTALLRFGVNPGLAEIFWSPESLGGGDDEGKGQGPGSNRKSRRAAPRKKAPTKVTT